MKSEHKTAVENPGVAVVPEGKVQLNCRVPADLKALIINASLVSGLSQEVLIEDAIRLYYGMEGPAPELRRQYVIDQLGLAKKANGRPGVKEPRYPCANRPTASGESAMRPNGFKPSIVSADLSRHESLRPCVDVRPLESAFVGEQFRAAA